MTVKAVVICNNVHYSGSDEWNRGGLTKRATLSDVIELTEPEAEFLEGRKQVQRLVIASEEVPRNKGGRPRKVVDNDQQAN